MGTLTCRIWFWMLRKTYPWMHLVLLGLQVLMVGHPQRQIKQIQFWRTVYKIDFAALLTLVMEIVQPEFWL